MSYVCSICLLQCRVLSCVRWKYSRAVYNTLSQTLLSIDSWQWHQVDLDLWLVIIYRFTEASSPLPLGPLCQPPSFLIPYFPFPPSLSLSSLHPFTFPSPALLSLTFPSLPCHEASLQIQLGVWRSAVSYPSGVWGRAPASKAFWLHFEPRKHVWCQQFWFFFVLSNKYKFCHDVLKMSPLGILIRCERSPLWATKPLQVYIGRPYIIFVYWGKCSAWCKIFNCCTSAKSQIRDRCSRRSIVRLVLMCQKLTKMDP